MRKTKRPQLIIKGTYPAFVKYVLYVVFAVFKALHWQHFKQEWNGKKRLKLIAITGLRSALVDDVGQRARVSFYWKVGKYYI
jgi:hypothetical protein